VGQSCLRLFGPSRGVQFTSNLKIIPLPYYDLIVGMDWLECHNPMRVDWLNKWMMFNLDGIAIQLHGLQPSLPELSVVEVLLISQFLLVLLSLKYHCLFSIF
jgi:hypothetical protein